MNRRGKTLLELMVTISMLSVVMLAVGQMTTSMMRADSSQSAAMRRMDGAARLAARFRSDAHAAVGAETPPAGDANGATPRGLIFTLPGGRTVVYAADARITRTAREGEKQVAFDAWPADPAGVRFEKSADGHRVVLECGWGDEARPAITARGDTAAASRAAELWVEAVVGFDHRFSGGMR